MATKKVLYRAQFLNTSGIWQDLTENINMWRAAGAGADYCENHPDRKARLLQITIETVDGSEL